MGHNKNKNGPSGNIDKVAVTFFADQYAYELTTKLLTLVEVRDLVLATQRRTKARLPWLKLAAFGSKRSKNNSLRHDPNVTGFSGIELDYDREEMSFDEAVAILKAMKIRCLIYTSPSHTDKAPRWRILIPVSRKLALKMRGKLCARVNGRFGGVFGSESFTLSQSYYFGLAKDNPAPHHRAVVIDGRFIDLADDLYKFEKNGWPKDRQQADKPPADGVSAKIERAIASRRLRKPTNVYQQHRHDLIFGEAEEMLACMRFKGKNGNSIHETQRDVSYALVRQGVPDDEVIGLILAATLALPEARRWNPKLVRDRYVKKLVKGAHVRIAKEEHELKEMTAQLEAQLKDRQPYRLISLDQHDQRSRDFLDAALRRG